MNIIHDEYYITFTNAANSKANFLGFLKLTEEDVAYEFVDELWDEEDVKAFWKYWDGDLDRLGDQVILFDSTTFNIK